VANARAAPDCNAARRGCCVRSVVRTLTAPVRGRGHTAPVPHHVLTFTDTLTEPALRAHFEGLERFLAQQKAPIGLVVDCTAMTAYTPEARALFVEWHRAHRERIRAVGIVTPNMLWHMIVRTMALASGQTMRPFVDLERAIAFVS